MRTIKAISLVAVSITADPCQDLCTIDGAAICSNGTRLINDNICENYFIQTQTGGRCYRDAVHNRDNCVGEVVPLRIEIAERIIGALRRFEAPIISSNTTPSNVEDNASQNSESEVGELATNSVVIPSSGTSDNTSQNQETPVSQNIVGILSSVAQESQQVQDNQAPSATSQSSRQRGAVRINLPRARPAVTGQVNQAPNTASETTTDARSGVVQVNVRRPQQQQVPVELVQSTHVVPRTSLTLPRGPVRIDLPRSEAIEVNQVNLQAQSGVTDNEELPLSSQAPAVVIPQAQSRNTSHRRCFPAGQTPVTQVSMTAPVPQPTEPLRRRRVFPVQQQNQQTPVHTEVRDVTPPPFRVTPPRNRFAVERVNDEISNRVTPPRRRLVTSTNNSSLMEDLASGYFNWSFLINNSRHELFADSSDQVIDGLNRAGRSVVRALSRQHGGSFEDAIEAFVVVSKQGDGSNYQEIWRQSGGPQVLEAALQLDVNQCGVVGYNERNACFTYMFMATNIPLPGEPGSLEFNNALAFIGLTEFISNNERALNLRSMLQDVSTDYGYFGISTPHQIYIRSFGHNWIARCPSITNSTRLRGVVFRHRLYRYTALVDPRDSAPINLNDINRGGAFASSAPVLNGPAANIRRGLANVRFNNGRMGVAEDAYGDGVRNDWFSTVTREIFSCDFGIFDIIKSFSVIHSDSESLLLTGVYGTIGRFIALSLVQGNAIGALLPQGLAARLLGQNATIEMIEEFDEGTARSLRFTAEYDLKNIEDDFSGPIPDSEYTDSVNSENRDAQVQAAVNNLAINRQRAAFEQVYKGFHEILPNEILDGLSPLDLQGLIYGAHEIVIDDTFLTLVNLGGILNEESVEAVELRGILQGFSQDQRRLFLRLVTGNTQLPLGGFRAMKPRMQIVTERGLTSPVAQTCFSRLNLPIKPKGVSNEAYRKYIEYIILQGMAAFDHNIGMSESVVHGNSSEQSLIQRMALAMTSEESVVSATNEQSVVPATSEESVVSATNEQSVVPATSSADVTEVVGSDATAESDHSSDN
jgi:hypothetical protein